MFISCMKWDLVKRKTEQFRNLFQVQIRILNIHLFALIGLKSLTISRLYLSLVFISLMISDSSHKAFPDQPTKGPLYINYSSWF